MASNNNLLIKPNTGASNTTKIEERAPATGTGLLTELRTPTDSGGIKGGTSGTSTGTRSSSSHTNHTHAAVDAGVMGEYNGVGGANGSAQPMDGSTGTGSTAAGATGAAGNAAAGATGTGTAAAGTTTTLGSTGADGTAGTGTAAAAASSYLANALNGGAGYTSPYQQQLDSMYDQIMNRGQFQYDLNGDALYNQYREQYTQQGQRAMQDTMGQAAALTGGYGSSYATQAGNQAYQEYLTKLSDMVPTLYDKAYQRWSDEGQQMTDRFNTAYQMEGRDYDRYQTEKQQAYSTAMTMLQSGYMPSDDMLQLAGMSADDAYILWYANGHKQYRPGKETVDTGHHSSGSSRSSSSGGSGSSSSGSSSGSGMYQGTINVNSIRAGNGSGKTSSGSSSSGSSSGSGMYQSTIQSSSVRSNGTSKTGSGSSSSTSSGSGKTSSSGSSSSGSSSRTSSGSSSSGSNSYKPNKILGLI